MIQWLSGRLEASYVGEPSKLVLPGTDPKLRRYQLRVFRAAVRDVTMIAAPADARPPVIDPPPETLAAPLGAPFAHEPSFRQARIDEALVADLRGRGSYFLGALFDVRVSAVELSHPAEKGGRAYGRMTGTVVACAVLPAEPEPERVPASELIQDPLPALTTPGELHVAAIEEAATVGLDPTEDEPAPSVARAEARWLPSLLACVAVGGLLGLLRGALPAGLWAVFMLPTLVARRALTGVLPNTRGIQVFGAVLVAMQLACTSRLLTAWWNMGCHELAMLPLIGLVATLFPAGLLPSAWPLSCNAVCLAAILFGWC